jgi:hypothetical protein
MMRPEFGGDGENRVRMRSVIAQVLKTVKEIQEVTFEQCAPRVGLSGAPVSANVRRNSGREYRHLVR